MAVDPNKRSPNFYKNGRWYMVRCYSCSDEGTENNLTYVASGQCFACGATMDADEIDEIYHRSEQARVAAGDDYPWDEPEEEDTDIL